MSIRDRGKKKWQSAFMMPEHIKLMKDFNKEYNYQSKPIVDEYEWEEFDNRIHLAMEFTYPVKFRVWENGSFNEYDGKIHRLDEINKVVYLEQHDGYFMKIMFDDVVRVEVEE